MGFGVRPAQELLHNALVECRGGPLCLFILGPFLGQVARLLGVLGQVARLGGGGGVEHVARPDFDVKIVFVHFWPPLHFDGGEAMERPPSILAPRKVVRFQKVWGRPETDGLGT